MACVLDRDALHQRDDRTLRRCVRLVARRAHHRGPRRRDGEAATFAALDHVPHRRAPRVEHAVEIDSQHSVPLVGGEVDERRVVAADPRVGEARVDLPEGVDGRGERRLDLRLVPDVALQGQHLGAVPAELLGRGLVLGLVGAPDRDVGPLRRQPVGHAEPDAAVAAGHQAPRARSDRTDLPCAATLSGPRTRPDDPVRSFECAGLGSVVRPSDVQVAMILETIKQPADLRRLSYAELDDLAGEIRDFIVQVVSENAGPPRLQPRRRRAHAGVASGVRLARATSILWDTGHQAYVHKLVTGRQRAVRIVAPGRRPVGLPVPRRVRPRLRREQPRVDDLVVRLRARVDATRRSSPASPTSRRGVRASHRRRDRRRVDDRRHGLRGAQQPRAQRAQRHHRLERQRPLVRADRVEPVEEPHAGAPQPGVHAPAEAARAARAHRAGRRQPRAQGHGGHEGGRARDVGAGHVLRAARRPLHGPRRRAPCRRSREGAAQRGRVRRADRAARADREGPRLPARGG